MIRRPSARMKPKERAAGEVRSPLRTSARLPDFVVIGAMKAGTTSLFEYLRAHPDIFMSSLKEVDFFVRELNWPRGIDWYSRQFRRADSATVVGEASPSYTKYPEYTGVPERMARLLPNARLIYLVRDPIERIRSHYQHRAMTGSERDPIEVAALRDARYVDASRYAMQLERYMEWFPRDRILVVASERLREERAETMRRVQAFLGVDPDFVAPTIDREFYRTQERAGYPPYVWWIRRNLKQLIPPSKRWWLRRSLNRRLPDSRMVSGNGRAQPGEPASNTAPPGAIGPELRAQLIERLRDDVVRFRAYMSEDFDGWGIA